ncbi:uroporphyrinogen-III C-methyltransferase [Niabella beijingensis]|uniref:uroporphyrinogen-III C-methyltransferase n=1 Tax=Niabella beijingensis TaxID=2872700 RepID=UPI001CC02135|nr:uroporphyrinogen-III C-methyltransferase [Niabella beijingensis]MBZ4190207.1 uroporphyrinogen-III C-methyltransferase [Niabella beijingensis]
MAKLILVGAGPGDPELITLKAIKALEKADVILYDALANETLLDHAQPAAVRRFVGKRFGCHALSQQAINDLITEYGQQYEYIVRLKGGDPFVFGRAQEEIDAAVAAGMEVAVIPGISSAFAVPASEMLPLTCRGINESFWVITGTTRSGAVSDDIALAARSTATVVLLMAMSKLETIMDIFIEAGKGETAAAIIQNGTRPDARMVTGKVKDIAFRAQHRGLGNPAVIIIGDVVNLNRALADPAVTGSGAAMAMRNAV